MAEKRNEIIEEQRRAREEFLKLKKMQQGEIEPEAKPSEVAINPQTLKEKRQNFWYYYKFHTIFILILAVIIAILTVQCATREKYDFSVMYFVHKATMDSELHKMEEYFESVATDVNGDGEVNVNVVNCSFNPSYGDLNYRNTIFTKVQAIITAEYATVLYVIDKDAKAYFDSAFDIDIFAEEPLSLGKDFYDKAFEKKAEPPKDLMLGIRVIKGTTFESKEEAQITFDECKRILDEMKKQNS